METSPDNSMSSNVDLNARVRSLRLVLYGLLFCMALLAASLFVFLLRQNSMINRQISELSQFVSDYQSVSAPAAEKFVQQLESFAEAHPDYTPILRRYISPTNRPAITPPGPTSSPPTLVEPPR